MSAEALAQAVERMEDMRVWGCIISLRLGPYGWSCTVSDPDVLGTNVAGHKDPAAAVEAVYMAHQAKLDKFHGVTA